MMPSPNSTRTSLRLRSGLASTAVTSTGHRLNVETDRHHQVAEVFVVDWLQQPRAQGRDQAQHDLVALDAFDSVAQKLGVKADLQSLPLEHRWHCLLGITDIRGRG